MSTLAEYRADLEALLSTVNLTGFFTDAIKNEFINRSGRRVYNFQTWPFLNHALKTQSVANDEYYEQPSRFKKGSIYRITVGEGTSEEEYDMVSLNLYKQLKEQSSDSKISTVIGGQYFINPILTENNLVIGVYGQLKWVDLVADGDKSINPEAFDEAIIKHAFASALKKERRFSEANSEIDEVENAQSGILPRLYNQATKESPKGYVGNVQSSRW